MQKKMNMGNTFGKCGTCNCEKNTLTAEDNAMKVIEKSEDLIRSVLVDLLDASRLLVIEKIEKTAFEEKITVMIVMDREGDFLVITEDEVEEKYPDKILIGTELEDLQKAVGGYIEVTYPFSEEVGLVMNEEGKLNGLSLNRALRSEDGDVYDVIAGDFLVVGLTDENFGSLTPEQMDKFEAMFHQLEMFVKMGRSVMAIPLTDDQVEQPSDSSVQEEVKKVPLNWEFGEETVSLNVADYAYGGGLHIGITSY